MAARSLIPKSAAPIWFWSAREAVEHRRVESALAEGGRLQRQLEDENAYLREQADTDSRSAASSATAPRCAGSSRR